VGEGLEREIGVKVNLKEVFKLNKDKMMLAKIEKKTQKKLREADREERDREKRVIVYME
jgi:hypothetical protein